MPIKTRKSDPMKPARILIYGVEGVGKSTLGAKADHPIFISPEGGTDHLRDANGNPVDEMVGIETFDGLRAAIRSLITEAHGFKTLVLDSADWIEQLAHAQIVGKSGKTMITVDGGYGSGYRRSQNMHKELISELTELREKRGMNIIVTAHAHVKPVKDPEMLEDYDQFEIKCHEMVSSLWREWVDALLFARFTTFVKAGDDDSKRARALTDGTRTIYTMKKPAFQAKNRYGLPPEMPFTENFWAEFTAHRKKTPEVAEGSLDDVKAEIAARIEKADEALREKVRKTVTKAGESLPDLVLVRNRLREMQTQTV